jgi:hypothetical protein
VTFRVNYNITPDISIQYYGSPFVSSGIYDNFRHTLQAGSKDVDERTQEFRTDEISYNPATNQYHITVPAENYSFSRPDFSFREFRSNLVARWEYRPGSTIYVVWENRRQSRESIYFSDLGHNFNEIMQSDPVNIFMIKMSFWLGL